MRKRRLITTIIILVVIVLALAATAFYLMLNSSPKKMFLNAVDNIFAKIDSEEQYLTEKSSVSLAAEVDSEDKEISAINDMIKNLTITMKEESDFSNKIFNGSIAVKDENEDIVDVNMLIQDNAVYVYYKELIDKYLEIPLEEDVNLDELMGQGTDVNTIIREFKNELKLELEKQNFTSEKASLMLSEGQVNVKKSTLKLDEKGFSTFSLDLLKNMKNNQNFMNAFGNKKEEFEESIIAAVESLEEEIENLEESNNNIEISIYTKGLFNNFVKFEIVVNDTESETKEGIAFTKASEGKYELLAYEDSETIFKLDIVDNKTSKTNGTMTITLSIPEEAAELVANLQYEKKGNATTFILTSEVEEVSIKLEGTVTEQGNATSGDIKWSIGNEDLTIILKCNYQIENGASIVKQNINNSSKIDELTAEEMEEMTKNFQNSKLYKFMKEKKLIDLVSSLSQEGLMGNLPQTKAQGQDETYVKKSGYMVKYNAAEGFEASGISDNELRMYFKDTNSISVFIEDSSAEQYLNNLNNDEILKSALYTDQKIGSISKEQIGDNNFAYRVISYKEGDNKLMKLVYCYDLDGGKTYVVELEAEQGAIKKSEIEKFLNIEVSKY